MQFFITSDRAILTKGSLDPDDLKILEGIGPDVVPIHPAQMLQWLETHKDVQPGVGPAKPEEFVTLTPELMDKFSYHGAQTHDMFERMFSNISQEHAERVRVMRVQNNVSWRAIARWYDHLTEGDWGSNQLAGMAICRWAATHHKEHYLRPPWN